MPSSRLRASASAICRLESIKSETGWEGERESGRIAYFLCLSLSRSSLPLSVLLSLNLEYVGKLRLIGQLAVQSVPIMIGDLAAVFFGRAGSRRRYL